MVLKIYIGRTIDCFYPLAACMAPSDTRRASLLASRSNFLKIFLNLCTYLCMHVMHMRVPTEVRRRQPLPELGFHVFVSLFTWVLGIELGFSGRAVRACTLWAISPAFIVHKLVFLQMAPPFFSPLQCGLLLSGNQYPASTLGGYSGGFSTDPCHLSRVAFCSRIRA